MVKYFGMRLGLVHKEGEGDISKGDMVVIFFHRHIVEENTGYNECEIIPQRKIM